MPNRRSSFGTMVGACVGTALALGIVAEPMEAQQQPAPQVPRSVLERYVGEYVYPAGNSVMIRLRGDTLFREIPGQQMPLVPISETVFRLGPVFTAEFVTDRTGAVTQILTGAATEFRLHRKGDPAAPPPPAPVAVRVPRSVLERYVGVYEYIPGQMKRTDLSIVVHLEGDTLIRELAGRQVLIPISQSQFVVAGTSLLAEFVVDDAGVTQVLGSGFQQMLARLTPKR